MADPSETIEVGADGLNSTHQEADELDLVRVAVRIDQHTATRLDDTRHLVDALLRLGD